MKAPVKSALLLSCRFLLQAAPTVDERDERDAARLGGRGWLDSHDLRSERRLLDPLSLALLSVGDGNQSLI
jgi:hypothetical protein